MPVSIKLNQDAGKLPDIGAGSYEIVGFSGGCVIIVDDTGKLRDVPRSEVDANWSTVTAQPVKAASKPAPAPVTDSDGAKDK